MKKIFLIILSILLFAESLCFTGIANKKTFRYGKVDKNFEVETTNKLVTFDYETYRISMGKIQTNNYITTKVYVEEYELLVGDTDLFEIGKVYDKGYINGDVIFEKKSKLIDIVDSKLVLMNLESSSFTFYVNSIDKVLISDVMDFSLIIEGKYFNIIDYEKNYNLTYNCFEIKGYFENNGNVLSSMEGLLNYKKSIIVEENAIYVPKNYVKSDEMGNYVYKLIRYNKIDYYQVIEVNIVNSFEDYYIIEGNISDNNIIISPL